MDKRSLRFIEELCNAPGPSGFEREVALKCKDYAGEFADRVYNDNIGNLMFEKGGEDGKNGPEGNIPEDIEDRKYGMEGVENMIEH